MNRRRILFVGGTTGGGVATINNEVAAIFKSAGYECRQLDTEALKKRLPVALAYVAGYALLVLEILRFRPRTVYLQCAQTGYLHQSLFLLFAKILGRRTIAHFHAKSNLRESCSLAQWRRIMFSHRYTDRMILLTEPCRSSLVDNGWTKATHVIPNFIDIQDLPESFPPVSQRDQILYLGRMDEEKGIFDILRVADRMPDYSFIFVGNFADKSQEDDFADRIAKLDNASWLGPMYDRRKYDILAHSRYLLFPTRRDEFPMTLIESTLLGCIPLVTLVGSVGEIIEDGFNGFFIAPGDIDGMVAKIRELDTRNDLQAIADRARERALSKFTSDGVRDHLLSIVEQA